MAWEDVEAPLGTFVGWGTKEGQHVTGHVTDFDETGGSDFNQNPCPLLEVKLTKTAASFNKAGERTNIEAGETVLLTIGQTNLRKKVKNAVRDYDGLVGKLVKITLKGTLKVSGGDMKDFLVQVDPSDTIKTTPKSNGSASDDGGFGSSSDDDEPPF